MSALLLSNAKVEELEYHPISFGEGLMSSLGYYMGKSQSFEKKPSSNSMIIVFMLGGITGKGNKMSVRHQWTGEQEESQNYYRKLASGYTSKDSSLHY